MSANDHVYEVIKNYATSPSHPRFALAIAGPWGSGKTHIAKSILDRKTDFPNLKVVYVSLFGLTSTQEIDQTVFAAMHPVLGGKKAKIFGKVAKGLLRATLKIDLDGDGKEDGSISPTIPDLDPSHFGNADKDTLLVFDDIDRTKIPIEVVLGYINYFVEHTDARCIVLVNEELKDGGAVITEEKQDLYRMHKEKTIGLTVRVRPDFDNAYQSFIKELFPADVKHAMSAWKEVVERVFRQSSKDNLRLVRQSLLNFCWVYDKFPAKARGVDAVEREYLNAHLPLAFEYFSGALPSDNAIREFLGADSLLGYMRRREDKETTFEKLRGKYSGPSSVFSSDEGYEFFSELFATGFVDEERLSQLIDLHPHFIDETTPDWRKLWHWCYLRADDIDPLAQKVLQQIKEDAFYDVYVLLHALGTLMSLNERELTSTPTVEDMQTIGVCALDRLATRGDLHNFSRLRNFKISVTDGHTGLGYPTHIPEFSQLASHAEKLRQQQFEQYLRKSVDEWLNLLTSNTEEFAEKICEHNTTFSRDPFFSRIDVNDFMSRICSMDVVVNFWHLSDGLKQRFEADNADFYEPLLPELQFFAALDEKIAAETANRTRSVVVVRGLRDLREGGLRKAIEQLTKCEEIVMARATF